VFGIIVVVVMYVDAIQLGESKQQTGYVSKNNDVRHGGYRLEADQKVVLKHVPVTNVVVVISF
jgi:hypothetical protein